VVAPTAAFTLDVLAGFQVRHDALHCSLGNPDLLGDIAEPDLRVACDQ
jgi:hypothetical protein